MRGQRKLAEVEELEPEVRESLRRVGVNSARDLERMERRNVDLDKVVREKAGQETPKGTVSYDKLADIISRARRKDFAPTVKSVSLAQGAPGEAVIEISGEHLDCFGEEFPIATVNGADAVVEQHRNTIRLRTPSAMLRRGINKLDLALDRSSVLHLDLNRGPVPHDGAET